MPDTVDLLGGCGYYHLVLLLVVWHTCIPTLSNPTSQNEENEKYTDSLVGGRLIYSEADPHYRLSLSPRCGLFVQENFRMTSDEGLYRGW